MPTQIKIGSKAVEDGLVSQEVATLVNDPAALAGEILTWRARKLALDELEKKIKGAVLLLKKTQVVGDVRARYTKGRSTLDYETPVMRAEVDVFEFQHDEVDKVAAFDAADEAGLLTKEFVEQFRSTITDWRAAAKKHKIEGIVTGEGTPSVKLIIESGDDGDE